MPLGLPPLPEDPVISRVAPEECLAYISWAGTAAPDAKSTNQTEQLLAEPEVQKLLSAIDSAMTAGIKKNARPSTGDAEAESKDIYPLAKTLLTRPAAVFLSKVEIGAQGPEVQGGAIFNLAEKTASGARIARAPGKAPAARRRREGRDCRRRPFHRIKVGPMPPVTWGIRGKYLIVGVGEGAVEGILKRAEGAAAGVAGRDSQATARGPPVNPDLLQRQADRHPVRPAGRAEGQGGPRRLWPGQRELSGLGHGVGWQGNRHPHVAGDRRPAARHLSACRREAAGGRRPVAHSPRCDDRRRRHDSTPVPPWNCSGANREDRPQAREDVTRGIAEMEKELGIDLQQDLLKPLGDVWCVYNSPAEGGLLVTGLTGVVQVKDHDRLEATLNKLVDALPRPRGAAVADEE